MCARVLLAVAALAGRPVGGTGAAVGAAGARGTGAVVALARGPGVAVVVGADGDLDGAGGQQGGKNVKL